jgi:Zn-dependent protease
VVNFEWWTLGLVVAALAAFIFLATRLNYINHLWARPLSLPEHVAIDAIPAHLAPLFAPTLAELARFGFDSPQPVLVHHMIGAWTCGYVAVHRASGTVVTAELSPYPSSREPVTRSFFTFFADGTELNTFNGLRHGLYMVTRFTRVVDPYGGTLAAQWAAHQEAQAEMGKRPLYPATGRAALAHINAGFRRYFAALQEEGYVAPDRRDGRIYPTFSAAWRMLRQNRAARQDMARHNAALTEALEAGEVEAPEIPVELEAAFFERDRDHPRRRPIWPARAGTFAGTMVLFTLSIAQLFNLEIALLLLVVLVVHEAGHLSLMYLRGYRELSFLFIPFLGALAQGRKENASTADLLLVLLAGPLPGLILGLGVLLLWSWRQDPFLQWTPLLGNLVVFAVIINYFNLIPVYPLDGGQVVDTLVAGRFPLAAIVFRVVAIGAFLIGMLLLREPLMILFGLFFAWLTVSDVRNVRRDRRIAAAFRQGMAAGEPESGAAFRALRRAGVASSSYGERVNMVNRLLRRAPVLRAGRLTQAGFWLIYLLSLVGAPLIFLWVTGRL